VARCKSIPCWRSRPVMMSMFLGFDMPLSFRYRWTYSKLAKVTVQPVSPLVMILHPCADMVNHRQWLILSLAVLWPSLMEAVGSAGCWQQGCCIAWQSLQITGEEPARSCILGTQWDWWNRFNNNDNNNELMITVSKMTAGVGNRKKMSLQMWQEDEHWRCTRDILLFAHSAFCLIMMPFSAIILLIGCIGIWVNTPELSGKHYANKLAAESKIFCSFRCSFKAVTHSRSAQ